MYNKYNSNKPLEIPEETIIWKYMDLWKFLDLINSSTLYLCRADQLGDQNEGQLQEGIVQSYVSKLINECLKESHKKSVYISSWSIGQMESFALWKIYTSSREAIAIKSNITRLIDAIKEEPTNQHINKVKYNKNWPLKLNILDIYFNKNIYYEFEQELRIYTEQETENNFELDTLPIGKKIKINCVNLIESVYLAPNATNDFKELISMYLKEKGIIVKIKKSGINDKWTN